jgi:MFS family permease
MTGSVRTFATRSWAAFREVARNSDIRRVEIAWTAFVAANGCLAIALLVVAYEGGGAIGVAALGVVQMLPSAVTAPIATGLGSRYRRDRILTTTYIAATVAVAVLALALNARAGVGPVFVLAGVVATLGTMVRPIQSSLMPALARSPGELVAANVVSSTGEGLGALVGPALGAALILIGGPTLVVTVAGVGFAIAAVSVVRVRVIGTDRPLVSPTTPGLSSLLAGASEGVRELARLPAPRLIITCFTGQTFVRGMLTVCLVSAAVSTLGLGRAGVGTLNAAIGAGGLLGAMLAFGLVGRRRLAPTFALGLVGWGVPILFIGLFPQPVLAVVLLAALGISNAVLDVSGFTLLQGTIPDRVRAAVLGVFEGLIGLTVAIGGVVASALVDRFGVQSALVVTGALLPALAVLLWPRLSRLDDQLIVPEAQLRLLQGVPMFEPLSLAVMEQLAGSLVPVRFPAGADIIREGDPGDAFYVIVQGTAQVSQRGQDRRTLGPGGSFGEIALIREVPRTATVRATTDVEAYRLGASDFLAAVTGNPYSASVATRVVEDLSAGEVP